MMRLGYWWLAAAALCALAGCASDKDAPDHSEGKMADIDAWLQKQVIDIPAPPYKVQPPDTIQVLCPSVKEIDKQEFIVRPDGKIYVPLAGEVAVANLTPAQIGQVIEERLRGFFQSPSLDVAVQVVKFKSKSIFVMGQVVKPGIKPYTGRDTVLRVLADAQLNALAWPQKIVIVRRNEDPNIKERVTVNVKEMFEHGSVEDDYLLEAGDVVYVPLSPLSEASLQFGKIIYPLIPTSHLVMLAMGI